MTRKAARNAVRLQRQLGDPKKYRVRARRIAGRCVIQVAALKNGHAFATVTAASATTWARAARQAGVR